MPARQRKDFFDLRRSFVTTWFRDPHCWSRPQIMKCITTYQDSTKAADRRSADLELTAEQKGGMSHAHKHFVSLGTYSPQLSVH